MLFIIIIIINMTFITRLFIKIYHIGAHSVLIYRQSISMQIILNSLKPVIIIMQKTVKYM